MLQTLLANDVRLDLGLAVDSAAAVQPIAVTPEVREQVEAALAFCEFARERLNGLFCIFKAVHYLLALLKHSWQMAILWTWGQHSGDLFGQVAEFVVRRLEQMLVDGGTSIEAVRAALAERSADPCLAARTARDLQVPLAVALCSLSA